MKNKNGKTSKAWIWAIVLVVVFVLGYFAFSQKVVSVPGGSSDAGCRIAPSVNLLAKNTLVTGTTPSVSANYSIYAGSYVGSIPSSPAKGKSLDVLATATNYLNTENKINSLNCDSNDLTLDFVPYSAPTMSIYDSNFNTLATATKNESSSANTITDTLKLSGTPLKSTGAMLVTVEYGNKTQATSSDISLSGATRVSNPTWYTPSSTTSAIASFTVPAIVDGGSKTYDLSIKPESGQTLGSTNATVIVKVYPLNPVILDSQTGTFQTSNTWQDSLGASQVIATVSTGGAYSVVS